jgi:biopolymer transport protein ExbD
MIMTGETIKREGRPESRRERRKRRLAVRIDMTPMVDIVMLLLIFYMVTTVFAMPQAMEINLPKESGPVAVLPENILNLMIDGENRIYWQIGDLDGGNLPILIPSVNRKRAPYSYRVDYDSLRSLLFDLNARNPKLNTLIKMEPGARFGTWIDVLDEIGMVERVFNEARARDLGITPEELKRPEYREVRFSYRYAVDSAWTNKDAKLVRDALAASQREGG